jgi:hypothetical protein
VLKDYLRFRLTLYTDDIIPQARVAYG